MKGRVGLLAGVCLCGVLLAATAGAALTEELTTAQLSPVTDPSHPSPAGGHISGDYIYFTQYDTTPVGATDDAILRMHLVSKDVTIFATAELINDTAFAGDGDRDFQVQDICADQLGNIYLALENQSGGDQPEFESIVRLKGNGVAEVVIGTGGVTCIDFDENNDVLYYWRDEANGASAADEGLWYITSGSTAVGASGTQSITNESLELPMSGSANIDAGDIVVQSDGTVLLVVDNTSSLSDGEILAIDDPTGSPSASVFADHDILDQFLNNDNVFTAPTLEVHPWTDEVYMYCGDGEGILAIDAAGAPTTSEVEEIYSDADDITGLPTFTDTSVFQRGIAVDSFGKVYLVINGTGSTSEGILSQDVKPVHYWSMY